MRALRTSYRASLVILHLLTGAVLTLTMGMFQRKGHPHPAPGVVRWWHQRLCRVMHLQVRLQGELPAESLFVVSNHISWLDIPVLGSMGSVSFVSKAEVRNWPLVGWLSDRAGTLFIRRGGGETESLKGQMTEKLSQGNHVILFPEGTTTDGSDVRPFFPRLFATALETGRAILPLALRYSQHGERSNAAPYIGDDALVPHILRVLRQDHIDVDVYVGQVMSLENQDRKTLANQARAAILQALTLPAATPSAADPIDIHASQQG